MPDRAYVFVHPPEEAAPVLAGQVIVMAAGNGGWCRFKYAREWLGRAGAFALDPVLLPLEDGVFESEPDFEVFSALRDSGPDAWGRRVIERRLGRHGLTELEFLLHAGDHRLGAFGFSTARQPPPAAGAVAATRLAEIVEAAHLLDAGRPIPRDLLALLGEGSGSLGGMRPKATVEHRGRLWVAKLPARDDRIDVVGIEHAMLGLARRAGVAVPDHRLVRAGRRRVLLVARFDREPSAGTWRRTHALSGLTVAGLHERDYGRGAYADLADWLRRFGARPAEDGAALFRRMALNILIGNTDDHLRNHAVVLGTGGYRLAPAYDLLPQPGHGNRVQAIAAGAEGRAATTRNALSECERFGLRRAEARAVVAEVREAVASARAPLRALDLPAASRDALAAAIDPDR